MPQRPSTNSAGLKKLEKLSDQLDTAEESSEATTKEVQHAQRTVESATRDVRRTQRPDDTKRARSKKARMADGKSKAAVELGRKGGTATAKILTARQRSALAKKAARTRWNRR